MQPPPDWFVIFNEASACIPSALLKDVPAGPGDAQRCTHAQTHAHTNTCVHVLTSFSWKVLQCNFSSAARIAQDR